MRVNCSDPGYDSWAARPPGVSPAHQSTPLQIPPGQVPDYSWDVETPPKAMPLFMAYDTVYDLNNNNTIVSL